jgi:hypothetical protein
MKTARAALDYRLFSPVFSTSGARATTVHLILVGVVFYICLFYHIRENYC